MGKKRKPEDEDDFTKALGKIMSHTVNEPWMILDFEKFMHPAPAKIALNQNGEKELFNRIDRINKTLGGPPEFIYVLRGAKPKQYDTYPTLAIEQIICCFARARYSVCRAHIFYVGASTCKKDLWKPPMTKEHAGLYYELIIERYWEQAEMCFIRIASLWDRIGQLLDFIFFNIRQYERDGFAKVFERIGVNCGPMTDLKSKSFWTYLETYVNSEKDDGLKWLIRRRNLLVHSMHLDDNADNRNDGSLFISEYNHLEESLKTKLKPGSAQEELERIHRHLYKFTDAFSSVLDLCEYGIEICRNRKPEWSLN